MTDLSIAETNTRPATAEWIRRHQSGLWRYLRFVGCPPDRIEDVMQDALLAAIEHGVPVIDDHAAAAWLRTTGRNLFRMELRTARRRPAIESLDRLDAVWHVEVDDQHEEYLDALDRCLPKLEVRSRRALELRYSEGASREAMAVALELSEAGVKQLLRRVRRALRRCIEAHTQAVIR